MAFIKSVVRNNNYLLSMALFYLLFYIIGFAFLAYLLILLIDAIRRSKNNDWY